MAENSIWKMLEDLSTKKGISEIVINGSNSVFVERAGEFIGLNVQINKRDILEFSQEVASYNKKEFSNDTPILDGRLPDGSRVWLNENSSLTFDTNFLDRTVVLEGEAFFDVTKMEGKKFEILSGDAS